MPTKPKILTFDEALSKAEGRKRLLLTGNGFSIACMNRVFSYDALHKRADFSKLSAEGRKAFEALNTKDFEAVMRGLQIAAALAETYASDRKLAKRMRDDAEALRDVLAETIAANHPDHPMKVTKQQYTACREFLKHFNCIYTTNYDLLLYWALMRDDTGVQVNVVDDGFRAPEDPDEKYVEWRVQNTNEQSVFYLHGALHLFDAGADLRKFTWSRTQLLLIEQIREALANEMYPHIVAEGESEEKRMRINHSGYLNRCYRSLFSTQAPIFIYGLALSDNDEHILEAIKNWKRRQLFVSIYGDPDTKENKATIARARSLADERDDEHPLDVYFFDAASAHVWG